MTCIWRLLAIALLTAVAAPAWALCSVVSTVPVAFGSVASTAVRAAAQSSSTTNAGLACTGSLLSLLTSNDRFYATFTSTQAGLTAANGDVIPYTLYANNSTSYPITRGTRFDFARNGIIDALGLLGGTVPKSVPLYVSTVVGANVASGVYTDTLSVFWDWSYCSGIGIGGICLGRDVNNGTQTLTLTLTVVNDCLITTPDISFGSAPVVSGFARVNQSLNVACTKGSSYTVGLNDGQHASAGRRRMLGDPGNYLAYDIFKSAGNVRWGSVGGARRASADADVNPGPGTGIGSQVYNYNARVYTDQPTPPEAGYSDSVVLDVQF